MSGRLRRFGALGAVCMWTAACGFGSPPVEADPAAIESATMARSLAMHETLRDAGGGSSRTLSELASSEGLAIVVVDEGACMSCLSVDVELRALRARVPGFPVAVLATTRNAQPVSEHLRKMRLPLPVYVATESSGALADKSPPGSLTLHLLAADGRVLFSQVRMPGSRQQLLVEDLFSLHQLLRASATEPLAERDD